MDHDDVDFFSENFPQIFEPYILLGGIDRQLDVAVYHAIDKDTGRKVAIKFVNSHKYINIEQLFNGITILTEVLHPNIITPMSVSETSNGLLMIVMADAPFSDLYFQITENGPMTEREATPVMFQLVNAIYYLHKLDIIHNSLRLENVLINKEQPHFEVSLTGFSNAQRHSINPTPIDVDPEDPYISPELNKAPHIPSFQSDIYSLGILFYEMITGGTPMFWVKQHLESNNDPFVGGNWCIKSEPLKNFLKGMLCESPEDRFTAEDLMSHDLFKGLLEGMPKTEIEDEIIRFFDEEMEKEDSVFLDSNYMY